MIDPHALFTSPDGLPLTWVIACGPPDPSRALDRLSS